MFLDVSSPTKEQKMFCGDTQKRNSSSCVSGGGQWIEGGG